MGTSITGFMTRTDRYHARAGMDRMDSVPWRIVPAFNHLMLFDGTRNDRNNVALSGNPYQTNIANLYDQTKMREGTAPAFSVDYTPGVGTGAARGASWPLPYGPLRQSTV